MQRARITIDRDAVIGAVPRRLFGTFVEHMGRAMYDGIHEPGHPTADAFGFRRDVVELVRELGPTIVRYPGGNFVSGYDWRDGIGPAAERPTRLNLAWHSTEPNAVGLHEFADWCTATDQEPMLAVNLGTAGAAGAQALVEYANHPGGTAWSDLRRANGRESPFGIRTWCLGNEQDGPWQLGHTTARDYGRRARHAGQAMRLVDPDLELVVSGSSNPWLPTFGEWDRIVLEETYDLVDHLSVHAYYERDPDDLGGFLGSAERLETLVDRIAATADAVAASGRHAKRMTLAVDEWNVWRTLPDGSDTRAAVRAGAEWPVAPRLLEGIYDVVDAVVVATLLHALLRRVDRVRIANLAQAVNVLGAIRTEPGGDAWRQTTFWPFARIAAAARGVSLATRVDADPLPTRDLGDLAVVDAAATWDAEFGRVALFTANRSLDAPTFVEVAGRGLRPRGPATAEVLAVPGGASPLLSSREASERIRMRPIPVVEDDGTLRVELPAASWAVLRWGAVTA